MGAGYWPVYFDHVDRLKLALASHEWVLWLHRYASVEDLKLILSYQFQENEGKLAAQRRYQLHRSAQIDGIKNIYADYRICVSQHIGNQAEVNNAIKSIWKLVHYVAEGTAWTSGFCNIFEYCDLGTKAATAGGFTEHVILRSDYNNVWGHAVRAYP